MFGTQLEYRLPYPRGSALWGWRLGRSSAGGNQLFRTKNFLPGGGGGVRFELSKKHHVNLRIDFAQGKDSHTWSVGVGGGFLACNVTTPYQLMVVNSDRCNPSTMGSTNHAQTSREESRKFGAHSEEYATCEK